MPFVTQVFLPKQDNLGKAFPKELYLAFQQRMIQRYRGWTQKGQSEGAWLSPSGEFYADQHWVYEIGHQSRDVRFWRAEKDRVREQFDQEDIWIFQYEGRQI